MQGEAAEWGEGVRVLWIGLALSYLLMLRASERSLGQQGQVNEENILRRGNMAFFRRDEQLMGGGRREADKVEVVVDQCLHINRGANEKGIS